MGNVSIRHWDKTGRTVVAAVDWGQIFSNQTATARKYFVENTSARALSNVSATIVNASSSSGDGIFYFEMAADTDTVVPPYEVAAELSAPAAGGLWSSTGTVYYVVTAINATGETQQSSEVSATIDDTTEVVTLTWTEPAGATGYKIYRSGTTGTFGATSFLITLGITDTYIDDGSIALTTGAPPIANTTAGPAPNYGTAPTLSGDPITIGAMAIGQQFAYWTNWDVPFGIDERSNPRNIRINFKEAL